MQTASRCGYPVISNRESADFGAKIIIVYRYELTLSSRLCRFAKGLRGAVRSVREETEGIPFRIFGIAYFY